MNADENLWDRIMLHPWKWGERWEPVRLIVIHASRGANTMARQYEATKNWQLSASNRNVEPDGSEWASMSNRIIGHDGRQCISIPDGFYPRWSLGHADPIAISFELAQPDDDTPFTEATLDRAAREVAALCVKYDIPPRVLPWLSADNHEAPGIARHDRSDNGRLYGKSDPGRQFDDAAFESRVRAYMEVDMGITAEEFTALKKNFEDDRRLQESERLLREWGASHKLLVVMDGLVPHLYWCPQGPGGRRFDHGRLE